VEIRQPRRKSPKEKAPPNASNALKEELIQMKCKILTFLMLIFLSLPLFAQESGVVISIQANLRGTPSNAGVIVTKLVKDETFQIYKVESPWYLIQSPKYVGWIHGNAIRITDEDESSPDPVITDSRNDKRPKTTTKPLSAGETPFQREYVGGTETVIRAVNDTDRILTLKFGGVTYTVPADKEVEIETGGGRYEYYASVPRATPTSGVKEFTSGYRWTWRFYIVRTRA